MKLKIWLAMITVYIVWGSTYLAIRYAVETIPPFLMAGIRQVLAGSILYSFMRLRGIPAPTWKEWKTCGIVGLLLLLGGNGLISWAEQSVSSSVTAILVGSVPLWIILLDSIRPNGVRHSWFTILGVAVGFFGIVILIDPFNFGSHNESVNFIGALALLTAAFTWSVGSLYSRENHDDLPKQPLLGSGMEMLVAGVVMVLIGLLIGEFRQLHIENISRNSLMGLGYLIFCGSLLGYASYSWLLGVAPTALVSTYAYVNPLVAVILGSVIAKEVVNARVLVSMALIVGAVLMINTTSWLQSKGRLKHLEQADMKRDQVFRTDQASE